MTFLTELPEKIWRALPFSGDARPLVTIVELNGVIGSGGPGRRGLSLARLEKTIEAAFKPPSLEAVALAVNSPGGSAVQSRLIFSKIRSLAEEKKVPVLTFIEDVGASGGYILSLAGDEIYADDSSVVGSIGVVSGGFGFHEAISRLGVERRVYTAGKNKAMLDPFQPEKAEDIERLTTILNDIHQQFIDLVKARRGAKLHPGAGSDEDETFTGAFWTGPKALERGLIDGIAQLGDFLRKRYGKDVRLKRITPDSGSLLRRLMSSDTAFAGGSLVDAEEVYEAAESRAKWARYGL